MTEHYASKNACRELCGVALKICEADLCQARRRVQPCRRPAKTPVKYGANRPRRRKWLYSGKHRTIPVRGLRSQNRAVSPLFFGFAIVPPPIIMRSVCIGPEAGAFLFFPDSRAQVPALWNPGPLCPAGLMRASPPRSEKQDGEGRMDRSALSRRCGGRGNDAVGIDDRLIAGVLVDPLDHVGHEELQRQQQDEDQHEADNGVLQSLLRLLTVLLFLRLGELDAQDHAEDGAGCADDAQQGTKQGIDQTDDRGCNTVKHFVFLQSEFRFYSVFFFQRARFSVFFPCMGVYYHTQRTQT